MTRTILAGAGFVALVTGAAWAEGGDTLRGKAYSQAMCSSCHAIGLTGASANVDAKPFRDIDLAGKSGAEFAKWLNTGHPPFRAPVISDAQGEDIKALMTSLQAGKQ
jgi:mono/diheme cytochrome c family protein